MLMKLMTGAAFVVAVLAGAMPAEAQSFQNVVETFYGDEFRTHPIAALALLPPSPPWRIKSSSANSRHPTLPRSPPSRNYKTYLEQELKPKADGDFALGSDLFAKRLWRDGRHSAGQTARYCLRAAA